MPPFFMGVFWEVKFGWWENLVVKQQALCRLISLLWLSLYTNLIVHCPVRFSLFYCTCVFSSVFETLSDYHCH